MRKFGGWTPSVWQNASTKPSPTHTPTPLEVQDILRLRRYRGSDFFSVRFSIPIPTYSLEDFSFLYFIIFIILHYISDYNSAPALDLRLIDFGANLHSLFRYHFCSCFGQSATSHFDLATLSCCLQAVVGQHVSL